MNIPMLIVASAIVGLIREDRRGFIDLCVGTTVIYAWDAEDFCLIEEDQEEDANFDLECLLVEEPSPTSRGDGSSNSNARKRRKKYLPTRHPPRRATNLTVSTMTL